jgi:hypothetical protein
MAYAVFEEGQLVYHDKFRTTKELCVTNADVVVTEEPYCRLGKGKDYSYSNKGRLGTFRKLCYAVGMISLMAQALKAELVLIRPVDWKSVYSLTKKTPPRIQEEIRAHLTGGVLDEDEQDAILIGTYYIDHVLVEAGE